MQDWLPLFPLNVVLLPQAQLPLHIFEERYKEMIARVRLERSEFGVVWANEKGLVDAGCTATIEQVLQEYPDGRLDILTLGRRRFEISRLNEDRVSLRGSVEYFDDDDILPGDAALRARAIAGYNELRALTSDAPLPDAEASDAQLSFRLARGIQDSGLRQVLLSSRSEGDRMRHLAEFIPAYLIRQRRVARVKAAAPRNGHGGYHPDVQ